MSCKRHGVRVARLRPMPGLPARVVACVMVSLLATLCMSMNNPDQALYAFLGGDLLVPSQYGGRPSIVALLAWFSPLAAFCFLFSDLVPSGLERDASAVIPRVASRTAWMLGRLAQLALYSASFALLGRLESAFGLLALGCGVDPSELFGVALGDAVLGFALALLLVLATNCLALRVDAVVAFSVVFAVHVATLVGVRYMPYGVSRAVAPWLPSTQGILAWHDCSGWTTGLANGVPGFSIAVSLAYLLVGAVIVAWLAIRLVRSCDVL